MLFLLVAAAGLGAPWAQDVLLLAGAGSAWMAGGMQPLAVAATAWSAILAADALSVWVGHRYGARWVRRPWAARFVPPQRLPGLEEGMRSHAALLSFVTRFLPGQRGTLFFLFGSLRMPWRPFLAGNALAALVQVGAALVGTRAFGWRWQAFDAPVATADMVLTFALALGLGAWWVRARRMQRP